MPSSLTEALAALTRAFDRIGVDWYLFGAQAAILRGSRRMTADVDVTVLPGAIATPLIIEALAHEGITPRFQLDDEFVARSRVLPLSHRNGMPVDVVLGGPGLDEYFHGRSETLDLAGTAVAVPLAVDLICMKLLAGRPHDLQDATAMANAGDVDLGEIRTFVESMASALEDDGITAHLNAFLKQLRRPG
ncbi:MAG: DUF6036 family nucleotidyltransferase [Nannocystaceae bacterium]